ncbi:hypothetical protein [Caballeronia sp. DA-9]|uniref:hypothetical protein n=1 Tax=Caballeronia sp. DA-9 TaxID=3436237 RepID=UPI003F68125E
MSVPTTHSMTTLDGTEIARARCSPGQCSLIDTMLRIFRREQEHFGDFAIHAD